MFIDRLDDLDFGEFGLFHHNHLKVDNLFSTFGLFGKLTASQSGLEMFEMSKVIRVKELW